MGVVVTYWVSDKESLVKRILIDNFGYQDKFRLRDGTDGVLPNNALYHPDFDERTAVLYLQTLTEEMGVVLARVNARPFPS